MVSILSGSDAAEKISHLETGEPINADDIGGLDSDTHQLVSHGITYAIGDMDCPGTNQERP